MKCLAVVFRLESGVTVIRATLNDIQRALTVSNDRPKGSRPFRCSANSSSSWFGNYSLPKFLKLVTNGDAKLLDNVRQELLLAISDAAPTWEVYRSPAGFHQCLPASLAGHPDNMYALRQTDSNQRKAITLFYNVGFSGGTSSAVVREYGELVMSIVQQLHAERVDVNLYGYVYCSSGAQRTSERAKAGHVLTVVEIARSENVFQPERIACTMISSFCRRGVFGLWEHLAWQEDSNPTAMRLVDGSYGTHIVKLDISDLARALPNIDMNSIVLLPEVGAHTNPSQLWEPINLKLKRSTAT